MRWLALLFFALLPLAFPSAADAAEIEVKSARDHRRRGILAARREFGIDLGHRLEEVVSRGVALYFVAEFDLTKARWYWMDEHVVGRKQTWRLSYNALTRQYRLSSGALHQNFATWGRRWAFWRGCATGRWRTKSSSRRASPTTPPCA
jgi:hypothetical protein